ncbi:MAG: ABC transporter substrate-binding protein [Clostridia bacterium]|nr:ABC transporter substrate-binding protein [Clostridia bacterium]
MNAKRILALVLALIFAFAFAACSNQSKTEEPAADDGAGEAVVYNVGVCQLIQHVALDAATQGFCDALVETLGEDAVNIDVQNASGDSNACSTIVNNFVSKDYDLIMANATPALQAAASATATIPILGTSITEYGVALEIADFDGTVGGNISGTSDLAPLDQQAAMIVELFPDAQNIGLLYCSAEPNSQYQIDVVSAELTAQGKNVKLYSFSDANDIAAVCTTAVSECDLIYVPTDNTVASSAGIVDGICRPAKVPVVAGEEGICSVCGTVTLSINYYDLGYATGLMAAKILAEGADISTMPIEYAPQVTKKYNAEICAELGVAVPEDYVAIATEADAEAEAETEAEAEAEVEAEAEAEAETEPEA